MQDKDNMKNLATYRKVHHMSKLIIFSQKKLVKRQK